MKCEELLGALIKISQSIKFYFELKKLKFHMTVDDMITYETELKHQYTIKYMYDHSDPDVYSLCIDVIPVYGTDIKYISEIAYDIDGDFSLEFHDKSEFCTEDVKDWLTEEGFFQSSTVHNFGNTDLQYWKDCVKVLKKIDKDLRKCTA